MYRKHAWLAIWLLLLLSSCAKTAMPNETPQVPAVSTHAQEPSAVTELARPDTAAEWDGPANDGDEMGARVPDRGHYVLEQSLVAGGEAFTFQVDSWELLEDSHPYSRRYEVEIEIRTAGGFFQRMSLEAEGNPNAYRLVGDSAADYFFVTDFNFDGYVDILFASRGDIGKYYYHGWLWNPDTERFEEIDLRQLPNLVIDPQLQVLKCCYNLEPGTAFSVNRIIDGRAVRTHFLWARSHTEYNTRPNAEESATDGVLLSLLTLDVETMQQEEVRYFLHPPKAEYNGAEQWVMHYLRHSPDSTPALREQFLGEDSIWFPDGGAHSFFGPVDGQSSAKRD